MIGIADSSVVVTSDHYQPVKHKQRAHRAIGVTVRRGRLELVVHEIV